ncbi:hypothetical protein BK654_20725 [Pseudomonas brassicacearum]|uniref:hypothetical protein n=1 Tax=Pseudomonas brassicacearum TaxID=930166 RepID=UPI000F478408|nr:hypothetical protein [Pseudomonas brassicacearum]ROM73890.1 hypothetical protein BK654_20725 [Pseudomonas brassicacearum]
MRNILTVGGAGMLLLIIGHAHAGDITCPAVTQPHKDTGSIEVQDDREWESHRLVKVANPALLQFNGAEYAIHEPDADDQAPTRATITYRFMGTDYFNLTF